MHKLDWLTRAGMLMLDGPADPPGGDPEPNDPPVDPPADPDPTDPPTDPDVPDPDGADDLGDKGKKALDAMKAKVKAAERKAREATEAAERAQAKAEGREAEWEAERKADAEREAKFRTKYLNAEIKAAAAGRLADPSDALRLLDLTDFEVSDDGEVDTDAINDAIADLIKTKPYLAAQGKRFQGDADAGARKATDKVPQLKQADMDRMSPEQVDEAFRKGQFADLISGK